MKVNFLINTPGNVKILDSLNLSLNITESKSVELPKHCRLVILLWLLT